VNVLGLVLMAYALLLRPARAAEGEFQPLFGSSTFDHCIVDKGDWSLREGVLAAGTGEASTESKFLLKLERFGNFILKFRARSDGGALDVLFRATIQPPGQLIGYVTEVGGQHPGELRFRKPGRMFVQPKAAEPGHAAPGFPDAVGIPFVEKASAEATLVSVDSAQAGSSVPPGQWVEYEIDGLGDHLLIKVNGKLTVHYRVKDSWPDGMIGFCLPPGPGTPVELKDIQIQVLGDVHWPEEGAVGDLTAGHSASGWEASAPKFRRVTDEEWSQESRDLLKAAGTEEGYRSLYNGKDLEGWHTAATFWTAEGEAILGEPRNVFLVTDKEYSDFILKGSIRLTPPGGNSGIQVRSAVIPDGMLGYQFDVGIPWWGQIYTESSPRGILVPVDDRMKRVALIHTDGWNDFVAICKGMHVIGTLNGQVTYDLVDYYGDKTGLIGLQIHAGAAMKVAFKDIRLRELP
jgi:hypothetical protein